MILEDINRDRLSYRAQYFKDFSEQDIRQLMFDFSNCLDNNYIPITRDVCSIYQKKDGSLVTKITKGRPFQDSCNWIQPGYINGYGHKLIDCYEQYKFNI